ncbi:MAG: hypothetical protein WD016_11500 [Balneolaceae bacterium]
MSDTDSPSGMKGWHPLPADDGVVESFKNSNEMDERKSCSKWNTPQFVSERNKYILSGRGEF